MYLLGKNSKNMQLLDVLVCNSANKPFFFKIRQKNLFLDFEKMVY